MSADFDLIATTLPPGVTLIEASAGTGKTYTIAGIFLRLVVEENLTIDEIVVTTYTEAATAELRDRIRQLLRAARAAWSGGVSDDPFLQGLLAAARVDPAVARQRLDDALCCFDVAWIQTIHGFCHRVLKDRAFESRLPFDAELITDQSALLREVSEDFWRNEFYPAPPAHLAAALLSGLKPTTLAHRLQGVSAHPNLRVLPVATSVPPATAIDAELAAFRKNWPGWREGVRALFNEANQWAKGESGKAALINTRLDLVELCATDPAAQLEAYEAFDYFTTSRIAKDTRAKRQPPEHAFFALCARLAEARAEYAAAIESRFLAWGRAELERRKVQRNEIFFDDLLTRLRDALIGPSGDRLAATVRSRLRAALIDEFQDTDPIQEQIFQRLFTAPQSWLFLIGDPKQAIYGFRGADVFSYFAAARRAQRTFRLGTNFRSTRPLVAAVNAIFVRAPQSFVVPEIQFAPAQSSGRADATPLLVAGEDRPPFRFLLPATDDPLAPARAKEELPGRVAAEVARLLRSGAQLGDRPLHAADLAILTADNHQARALQAALGRLRIPSVLFSNASVLLSREAGELQTLLAALDEPAREGYLRAALATRLFALTAREIDELASAENAWEKWLLRFQRWHEAWRARGFLPMFRQALSECCCRPRLRAQPDGERALTNILHLAEILHAAAAEQRLSPSALRQWLAAQRRESAIAVEHELRLERDDEAVKVVTVHKSKGLEYNVVFCPFGWGHAELGGDGRALFHDAAADSALTLDLRPGDRTASEDAARLERLAEHTRLLYVALTRARHECHFVWGKFQKNERSAANWILHPPAAGADPFTDWPARAAALEPSTLRAEITALATQNPTAIAVAAWPEADAPPLPSAPPRRTPPQARTITRGIPRDWRVSSFTALTEGADSEVPDYDHSRPVDEAAVSELAPTGIHAFPAGMSAGVCLHAIFEDLDFTRPDTLVPLVAHQLEVSAFDVETWTAPVAACVQRVLEVELAEGLRLRDLPLAACLRELEFYFPIAGLEPATLSRWLGAEAGGSLFFERQSGLLKGFIDLAFQHAGRFYVVDWKSNRLGLETAAYDAAAMQDEMRRHHYALQYHLYTFALHRYLALRLGAAYDYERHFGGVFYVFLRGVDPARPELGIHRARPSLATMKKFAQRFTP